MELFKIEFIRERTELTPEGEFITLMEVSFVTKSGIKSSVLIPKEKYTKELAIKQVEKLASELEGALIER